MEIFVDDEAKLTLHGLVQHYIMLQVTFADAYWLIVVACLQFSYCRCFLLCAHPVCMPAPLQCSFVANYCFVIASSCLRLQLL